MPDASACTSTLEVPGLDVSFFSGDMSWLKQTRSGNWQNTLPTTSCWVFRPATGKRSRRRVVRELVDEGYLVQDEKSDTEERATLTSLAWQKVLEDKPDLNTLWERLNKDKREPLLAVPINALTLPQQKYVLDHPAEYTFHVGYEWGGRGGKLVPYQLGTDSLQAIRAREKWGVADSLAYVSSASLNEYVRDFLFRREVDEVASINLHAGLAHLGLLPPGTPERALEVSTTMGLCGEGTFTPHPEKWAAQLEKGIASLLEDLAHLQQRLALLVTVQHNIYHYGGWSKFLDDYRQAIEHSVREHQAKTEPVQGEKNDD
jgi:hypothetical protein